MALTPDGASLGELISTPSFPLRAHQTPPAPVDLPPPPPQADPREPSPNSAPRQRNLITPHASHSPIIARGSSPILGPADSRSTPSDPAVIPLHHPVPRPLSQSITPAAVPINHHHSHLSRPSSPSSIHSSTSAIFERDIELPSVSSFSLNPTTQPPHTLSHKSSRLLQLPHGSQTDHTVPAVLVDAAEALAKSGPNGLEIEAPTGMNMTHQSPPVSIGRKVGSTGSHFDSRSPSPASAASRTSPAQSPPILAQLTTSAAGTLSQGGSSQTSPTSGNVPRPAPSKRLSSGQQVPGGWAWGTALAEPEEPVQAAQEVSFSFSVSPQAS